MTDKPTTGSPTTGNGDAKREDQGCSRAARNVVTAQLGIILVLVAVYLLQMATPLRLHHDSVILLSVAESAEQGGGYLFHGQPTVFPPGYPSLIAVLIRLNLAHVWVLVGINIFFLFMGLLAVRYMGFNDSTAFSVVVLSLLSVVFIKYSAIPLTDTVFFGVSMCCLAVMKHTSSQLTLRRVLASMCLVVASICVRVAGIALIPPFLWMLLPQCGIRVYVRRLSLRMKAAAVVAAISAAIAIACVVYNTSALYFTFLSGHSAGQMFGGLTAHFKELGEIFLNLSLPLFAGHSLPLIGLLVLLMVLLAVAWQRPFGVVEVYVVTYVAVILVWPFYDIRFWLPVVPLLLVYCGMSLRRLIKSRELATYLFVGYAFLFSVVGLLTLAANTRVSFSGAGFADSYPDRQYHSTNCAVWRCKELDPDTVDPDGLHLLHYYKQVSAKPQ